MAEQAGGEPSAVTPPEASAPAGRPEAAAAPPMPQSALIQLRQQHERRVLAILQSQGPTSRAELARIMKLSRSTVSNLTGALLATGSLVEVEPAQETQRSRGRPVTLLALNPAAGQTAGIDFGHRRVYVVIANLAHQVVGAASRRHGEQTSWKRRAAIAVELLEALATQHDIALDTLGGIGVGLYGPGDQRSVGVRTVTAALSERFGAPVLTDNNTRLAALAESQWGTAAGLRNLLYIRLSQGVGGALVLDGKLHRGASGAAGEFGHICVDPDGPACWCGRRGCLECYASTSAVVDAWGDASDAESPPVLDDLLEAVAAGDAQARLAVEQAGARVGAVLGAVCNAINPDDIVIGGDLVAAGAPLIDAITQALHAHSLPETSRGLHIRTARLGDDDGALGAIALALGEPEAARISPLHAARTDH